MPRPLPAAGHQYHLPRGACGAPNRAFGANPRLSSGRDAPIKQKGRGEAPAFWTAGHQDHLGPRGTCGAANCASAQIHDCLPAGMRRPNRKAGARPGLASCWKPVPPRPQSWNVVSFSAMRTSTGWMYSPSHSEQDGAGSQVLLRSPNPSIEFPQLKRGCDDLVDVQLFAVSLVVRPHDSLCNRD